MSMETAALVSSKFLIVGSPCPNEVPIRRPSGFPSLPVPSKGRAERGTRRIRNRVLALGGGSGYGVSRDNPKNVVEKSEQCFASISSTSNTETFSMGTPPSPMPPPSSSIGSPLFWIGIGVGLSALFSWVASNLKKYAMQQAFKTLMSQMTPEKSQFGDTAFSPGSPLSFSTASMSVPTTPAPAPVASQPVVTVDISATKLETTSAADIKDDDEIKKETKRYAFVDVSPEVVSEKKSPEILEGAKKTPFEEGSYYAKEVSPNGAAVRKDESASSEQSQSRTGNDASLLSVEALEKMMEDPTVQKMVYPYLPEEMRNPTTFKWMLQNPQYRQQLQDMLNNMGGSSEWDNKMMDSLKNFDLNNPDVKQQFDQIGLTPEEVISKIMANPEVAMAFQNPKVQAAIMDCSQNPLNIAKYQNDKEVMDVFNKISELFPGVTGSP